MSEARTLARHAALMFWRTASQARTNVGLTFIAPIVLSMFLLILFQGVYGSVADVPGWPTPEFIDWTAAGGVFLSVFVSAGYTASGLLRDVDSGYLQRLQLLPIHPAAVLVGKISFEAVRACLVATAVLILASLLGADTANGLLGATILIGLATVFAVAWNGIFYVAALTTRKHAAVIGLQPVFMPVIMFSTFWVPTTFMPGWYQVIATWNPFNPVLTAGRSALLGDIAWRDLALGLAVIVALATVTYRSSVRRYQHMTG